MTLLLRSPSSTTSTASSKLRWMRPIVTAPLCLTCHGAAASQSAELRAALQRAYPQDAALGYAAFESMYRGEETSDGEIELSTGEVSDVRKMLAIAKTLDFVDAERVGMIGFSHGGCITTKTMIAEFETNGPGSLDAVVNVFGPSNFVDVHALWQWRVDNVCPNPLFAELCAASQANIAFLEGVMGGAPDETPAAYAQHGTVRLASRIDAVDSPYLLLHGVQDLVVPVVNNCELAAALEGVEAWHFDAGGSLTTARPGKGIFSNPGDCAGIDNGWKNTAAPTTTYGDRTFIVYDNAAHDASQNQGVEFFSRATVFLGERLDP